MDDQLKCEYFLRQAFGFALNHGEWIERGGDPAGLAEAAVFGSTSPRAKAAIIYAASMYTAKLGNLNSEEDYAFIQSFPEAILSAKTPQNFVQAISQFREVVINEYFNVDDGQISLKA